ncbi:hypothetical protein Cni_G00736 [Canna indica]|uniref:RING-type E3 ubiquitin transferase n=1 Tax=Canna indica TaxID=4628 RepID=A0AAQ3JNE9_9LILI|nr:hypothetical protein Cni_G00736 [Canna indica]
MGNNKTHLKLSFHRSPSITPSAATVAEVTEIMPAPAEFFCPVSRSLMADPVVVAATGWTFERSCIEACADLGFVPPDLFLQLSSSSSPLILIPNITLKSAIVNWCDSRGLSYPLPIPPDAARTLVRSLIPSGSAASPPPFVGVDGKDEAVGTPASTLSSGSNDEGGDTLRSISKELDDNSRGEISHGVPPLLISRTKNKSLLFSPPSTCSSLHHTTTSSSAEIVVEETPKGPKQEAIKATILSPPNTPSPIVPEIDESEEEILIKSMDSDVKQQEVAAVSLRHATRVSRDCRIKLCNPRLLAALRSMLLSRCDAVQVNAVAAMVNISLEPENKFPIVHCGAVLPLVDVLKRGNPEAREHAAAVFFSLALKDENRVTIGSLGAIPPLLSLFARTSTVGPRARRDSGKALYYLSLAGPNRHKIVQTAGAVRLLLAVASKAGESETAMVSDAALQRQGWEPAKLAMMVVSNLGACGEGRTALMDADAVSATVALMRNSSAELEELCVAALYGMSRDRLRFPGLAKAAKAEQMLVRVAEGGSGSGNIRQKMARKTLRTIRREEEEDDSASARDLPGDDDGDAVSDGLMSFRRYHNVIGNESVICSSPF